MEHEVITLLRQFIGFRTVAGENDEKKKCLEWIHNAFLERPALRGVERLALSLDSPLDAASRPRLRKAMWGDIDGAPYLYLPHPTPKLLWFAHIDVVPADDHQFDLIVDDDRLIGRGTADMKGNQLPFLIAYRDALRLGMDPAISILFTSDEETAGQTIPTLLDAKVITGTPVAFTPDCGPKIVCEHKGIVWADLVCTGKGCHAAYPWAGKNPIFLLMEALANIKKKYPPEEKEEWRMTVTPTDIKGSDARNQIPESASCKLDIRYTADTASSPEDAIQKVKSILPHGCVLTVHQAASPLNTDPKHPMVQLMKRLAEEVSKEAMPIFREPGGTDARYFGEKGIPAFLCGVEGGGIHGKEEWVSLSSLLKNYELSKRLIAYTLSDDGAA